MDLTKQNLQKTDTVNFLGVITEKLPNTEFMVKITHLPDGSAVPMATKVVIMCKLMGKVSNRRIKIAIYDQVKVAVSMESALGGRGVIVYREKGKPAT